MFILLLTISVWLLTYKHQDLSLPPTSVSSVPHSPLASLHCATSPVGINWHAFLSDVVCCYLGKAWQSNCAAKLSKCSKCWSECWMWKCHVVVATLSLSHGTFSGRSETSRTARGHNMYHFPHLPWFLCPTAGDVFILVVDLWSSCFLRDVKTGATFKVPLLKKKCLQQHSALSLYLKCLLAAQFTCSSKMRALK